MDSYGDQQERCLPEYHFAIKTSSADAVRNLANKSLQVERLLQDKSRLQSELDAVCRKLEVDRLRLRDLDYATQPSQNAGHGWNFNTRYSFANRIVLNSHSLKEECRRLQEEKANLIRQIHRVDQQIHSLRRH